MEKHKNTEALLQALEVEVKVNMSQQFEITFGL